MEWYSVIFIFFSLLVLLLLTGLPVALCFLIVNLTCLSIFCGGVDSWFAIISSAHNILLNEGMIAVPLFIFMGDLLMQSGLAWKMCDSLDAWMGNVRGRLSYFAIIVGTVFSAMSGSGIATAAMLGVVLIPEMRRRGYSKELCAGPILAGAYLAPIIPPSIIGVILGSIAGVSIGTLLATAVVPGFFLCALYLIYIGVIAKIKPQSCPVSQDPKIISWGDRMRSLPHILPMAFIVTSVVGVIFVGICTPTEAASLGAIATTIVVIVYGKLNKSVLVKSMLGTVRVNSMVFFIIIGSQAFSQILAYTGVTKELVNFAMSADVPQTVILFVMQLIIFVMGFFVDQSSIIMIATPMFMPIVTSFGCDPIWFCVIMLINLSLGGITPPFGLFLYALKGVAPSDFTMEDLYLAVIPYVLIGGGLIVFLILSPGVLEWLVFYMNAK